MNKKAYIKQVSLFVLITVVFVTPYLLLNGTNIVTNTYAFGSRQFWLGLSPYTDPRGQGDWFKYSPLFAWLYTPFASMPRSLQAAMWGLVNIILFWAGVCLWFPWGKFKSRWMWVGVILCSMEADGSFRYQQMNAALVGLVMIGTFLYKENRAGAAGVILAIATNIKILPGLFLLGLIFPIKKRFLAGILVGGTLCLAVPLSVWGLEKTWLYHREWYFLLFRDTQTEGLLDVATILGRLGFHHTKLWVLYPISIVSLTLFLTRRLNKNTSSWDGWMALGLCTLLLVNPRTESPTFVMGGPAYLFLLRHLLDKKGSRRTILLGVWCVGVFLITLCMNDIWPKFLWNPGPWRHANKTLGIFLLWTLSAFTWGTYMGDGGLGAGKQGVI